MDPSPAHPPRVGLARLSVVFGMLGLIGCLPLLGALVAIPTGHVAAARARRDPRRYGGAGLATAGFITGYVGLVIGALLVFAVLLPSVIRSRAAAGDQDEGALRSARFLVNVVHMYAAENQGALPQSLEDLRPVIEGMGESFEASVRSLRVPAGPGFAVIPRPGDLADYPGPDTAIIYERHTLPGRPRAVGFLDGSARLLDDFDPRSAPEAIHGH